MARFIVRYRRKGPKPEDAAERVARVPGTLVVEETGRMLLVEGEEAAVRSAFPDAEEWLVEPERIFSIPDPRAKVERPPRGCAIASSPACSSSSLTAGFRPVVFDKTCLPR